MMKGLSYLKCFLEGIRCGRKRDGGREFSEYVLFFGRLMCEESKLEARVCSVDNEIWVVESI